MKQALTNVTLWRRDSVIGGMSAALAAAGVLAAFASAFAAAHAYVAEPQLFSEVRFTDAPPSWTEMATNPDPRLDSFSVAVWGALSEYDWTDLVKGTLQ